MTKQLTITRLRRDEPQKIIKALPALYEIDVAVFKKWNQYGLSLLKLALIQPEAFWLVKLNDEYVGYLSIFQYKTSRLCSDLIIQANKGILDLPDLTENRYRKLLILDPLSPDTKTVHIYIDAIAINKHKMIGIPLEQAMQIRKELISVARMDLSHLIKPSISTVAVSRGLSYLIEKLDIPFKPIGIENKLDTRKKYRKLFVWRGRGHRVVDRILDTVSNIGFGRFEVFVRHDPYRGTTEVGGGVELRR